MGSRTDMHHVLTDAYGVRAVVWATRRRSASGRDEGLERDRTEATETLIPPRREKGLFLRARRQSSYPASADAQR